MAKRKVLRATFRGTTVVRAEWGLNAGAFPARCEEARNDLRSSSSSLHLFVRRLGSWPVRWLATSVDIPPARPINERMSLAAKTPMAPAPPGPISSSSDGGVTQTQERASLEATFPGKVRGRGCFSTEARPQAATRQLRNAHACVAFPLLVVLRRDNAIALSAPPAFP